jgi:nitroreductase
MKAKDAILARRTAHLYLDETIDDSLIKEALEAALMAPNHKFTFPWHFVWVGPQTRLKLAELRQVIMAEKKGPAATEDEKASRQGKCQAKILNPAGLVAFCMKRDEDETLSKENYATIACSIQNFTIALRAHGWDSKWSTGGLLKDDRTYQTLGIDRETLELCGLVYVGHSAVELPERRRPSLDEVLVRLN